MDQGTFERASQILDAVIDAPRAQRAELLTRHCGADHVLRDHLISLLEAMEDDEFLEAPVVSLASADAASSLPKLTRIGPYEIVRLIGEGGMGTVYEARQESPRRLVAVKILRAGLFSTDAARRFARESQMLGLLHHPGIAQVYEAGTATTPVGELPYFAMELVRGLPLGVFCESRRLGVRAVLELLAHICDAAEHAHRQGVVHRDLKPANILVESPDAESAIEMPGLARSAAEGRLDRARPKILDFGVARAAQSLLPDGV
ncbi:MAG: serine/threonine protein kinase, partial [Pyrinomonadaceae bacterium]|nr:serine/threonine protein kinase [Phycisphaerales bacterium]